MPQNRRYWGGSGKGAEYEQQGASGEQSEARRPWVAEIIQESTESATYQRHLFRSFRACGHDAFTQGRRASLARRLPLAIIFRAFGAVRTESIFRAFGAARTESDFKAKLR